MDKIKQFGQINTNYACGKDCLYKYWAKGLLTGQTVEAVVGKSSMRAWRHIGAVAWAENQTKDDGMPERFHCRG